MLLDFLLTRDCPCKATPWTPDCLSVPPSPVVAVEVGKWSSQVVFSSGLLKWSPSPPLFVDGGMGVTAGLM